MHTKKIIFALFLSFCISNLAASEVNSTSSSNNADEQGSTSTDSSAQVSETTSSATEGNTSSSQTSDADKKPSMAEYCRKYTC